MPAIYGIITFVLAYDLCLDLWEWAGWARTEPLEEPKPHTARNRRGNGRTMGIGAT
jgi:hypothetical protein